MPAHRTTGSIVATEKRNACPNRFQSMLNYLAVFTASHASVFGIILCECSKRDVCSEVLKTEIFILKAKIFRASLHLGYYTTLKTWSKKFVRLRFATC